MDTVEKVVTLNFDLIIFPQDEVLSLEFFNGLEKEYLIAGNESFDLGILFFRDIRRPRFVAVLNWNKEATGRKILQEVGEECSKHFNCLAIFVNDAPALQTLINLHQSILTKLRGKINGSCRKIPSQIL